jgi:hypothetical protein
MYVNDVRIIKHVRNPVKLIYGHSKLGCPYPVVFGQGPVGCLQRGGKKMESKLRSMKMKIHNAGGTT